jgi:iron(III) transport system substrate-binding protein
MKRVFCVLAALFLAGIALSCKSKESNEVVIYGPAVDYQIDYNQKRFKEQFPQYTVVFNYITTGNLAAKLKAEGTATDCDIASEMDTAYLEGILDNFADLSSYDTSVFLDDLIPAHHKYLPYMRSAGCVMLNEQFLADRNIPVPASYQDLIKPVYKGVLSMPSPKTSSTGYFFVKNLVNEWGEDAAFAYFDKFADNVLQFTSSGSGPVNALIQGEAGVGLGMTMDVVNAINKGIPLKITYFGEVSPYALYANVMIKGKEERKAVRDVFEFYTYTLSRENKEFFAPEQIFKSQTNSIPNYPKDIKVADMRGVESLSERERLMEKWKY